MNELYDIKATPGSILGSVNVSWKFSTDRPDIQRITVEARHKGVEVSRVYSNSLIDEVVISGLPQFSSIEILVRTRSSLSEEIEQATVEISLTNEFLGGFIDPVGRLEHNDRVYKGNGFKPKYGLGNYFTPSYWSDCFKSRPIELYSELVDDDVIFSLGFSRENLNILKLKNMLTNHVFISYDPAEDNLIKYPLNLDGQYKIKTNVFKNKLLIPAIRNKNDSAVEFKINNSWVAGIIDKSLLEI